MKPNGTLCDAHSAEWQKWAGGRDGWGPHNPMPRGITVKLADEQRAMIRKACQDGHGCEDADAPASKLAAINRGRGAVEIHKRTCRDLLRDSHGASVWDIDASTERDCVFDVYPPSEFDYEPADWADFNDLAYMPCTKGLLS